MKFAKPLLTISAALVLLSACSFEHRHERANYRDGGGYPTDCRGLTCQRDHQPLNGLHFASETLPVAKVTGIAPSGVKKTPSDSHGGPHDSH